MLFSLSGVKLPHRKNTQDMKPVRIEAVSSVEIPMSMHIGKPAIPTVGVGDKVYVGTLIGKQDGFVSSNVYSSVSGTVKSFGEIVIQNGARTVTVVIESDGKFEASPDIQPPSVSSREEFVEAIKNSGVVGLGGAGFPAYVKFGVPKEKAVEELIINCAECEPYITSDTRTMLDRTEDMAYGIENAVKFLDVKRVIIGIEKNKKSAIEKMKELALENDKITVKVLSAVYPQGGEKVLIYHTTGKVVPAGKLPIDVGCIVCNCTSIAAIGSYIKTGKPLVTKCVTIDGGAIREPKNVIAPIGARISEVIELAGGFSKKVGKIIVGGPMMGNAIPTPDFPIMKNTNAVLAFDEEEAKPKPESACIRCGSCASHCPYSLNPAAFYRAYKTDKMEELDRLRVDICMECGCCSFICPAGKPLAQTNKLAKAKLRQWKETRKEGK